MEQTCHWRYYINTLVSAYLSLNWQERLAIDKSGSWSMEQKRYRRVLSIFKSLYLKYFKSIESERKFELSISNGMWQKISDPDSDHIFSHFLGTQLVYILFFSYVIIIHLLRRWGGVGIYCPLITDWIESTQAQILFSCQMQNEDTELNSKYRLKE